MADSQVAATTAPKPGGRTVGLVLGPAVASLIAVLPAPDGLSREGWTVVALAAVMAIWWATEAIPIPVTSLLPLVVLPLTGATTMGEAAAPYARPVVFLLLGGFIIATALERWNLHKRIALNIVVRVGQHPGALIGGFMAATALLSMWISNTATTLMMVPIALSVASTVSSTGAADKAPYPPFTVALLLGICYSASIGGLATPVGTPTNLLAMGFLEDTLGEPLAFAQWMLFGVPVTAVMLPIVWLVLTRVAFRLAVGDAGGGQAVVRQALRGLGRITTPEVRVALVFSVVAMAWMFRKLIIDIPGLERLTDPSIAIAGAVALFLVRSGDRTGRGDTLLDWDSAVRLPWGIVLLFGGGLSLAAAITGTGLAAWAGDQLSGLTTLSLFFFIMALVALVIFATELTSNTATVAALLPVLGAIAAAGGGDPILLAAPVAMAASCAFMLPVATPPNAIVFGSGRVTIPQMIRAGLWLNMLGILVITTLCYLLIPALFG